MAAETETRLRFYGLARARAEGWELIRFPIAADSPEAASECQRRLDVLRAHGAVVVDCSNRGDGGRVWWFGLPQVRPSVRMLEVLAREAGMLGDAPATFRWRRPA